MKRTALLFVPVALALILTGGVALAAVINGTAGNDTLTGTSKSDSIFGFEGNDTLTGSNGADELWGGFGSDMLNGGGGNDVAHGEGGDDTLEGRAGDDELRGADGKDVLAGGIGNDRLYDRSGDASVRDQFNCGTGTDTVRSDPGTDTVSRNCENVNVDGAQDLLPDLGMGQLTDIQIRDTGTQKQLRFDTKIVNVGAGRFEVTGRRPDTNTTDMTTTQRIYDSAGDYRDVSTIGTFFYSGDGHNHWHVKDLEHYQLFRLDGSGNVLQPAVGEGVKNGFCFYDNTNWGSTEPEYYRGCENGNPGALRVTMGLSRGWGDTYLSVLPTQYIDITGLADGHYRLRVAADEADSFLESDETNNFTWADLVIAGNSVTVVQYGPSAPPIG